MKTGNEITAFLANHFRLAKIFQDKSGREMYSNTIAYIQQLETDNKYLKEQIEKCADFDHSYDDLCFMGRDDGNIVEHCEDLRQTARSAYQEFQSGK